MTERPSAPPERAMTPLEAFDSRPKLPSSARFDPDNPFEHIPKPPRVPSRVSASSQDQRDTDPINGQAGFNDETPPDGPLAIRAVLKQLQEFKGDFAEMKTHCRDAANNSLTAVQAVQTITGEFAAIKTRLTALEIRERWMPRLAWLVTTVIAVIALLRTYR